MGRSALLAACAQVSPQDKAVMTLRISAFGVVHASALDGQHLELTCRGSGDSQLERSERLLLRLYGSGGVAYAGAPALPLRQPGSGGASSRWS